MLRTGGLVIDLRPITAEWPIEVVTTKAVQQAGRFTALPEDMEDDAASNRSFAEAEARGLFERQRQEQFAYSYYWDTPAEMKEYVDTEWEGWVTLSGDTIERARSLWALADGDARLHVGVGMLLTLWGKLG